jgi:ribose transport system ATP-binding protein
MRPALRMSGICKRFPGVTALDAVDFEVFPGEVVALIGENGAGKSTLMKILGGALTPDAGSIEIEGVPAAIRSVRDASRHGIALIHQEIQLLDNLDIASNIFLGREPVRGGVLRLIDRKTIESETRRQLDRVGLSVVPRTLVSRLSLAQQQMVEIAKALTWNARFLIMDEPTSALTGVEAERLFQLVGDLRGRGVSVVYISHRLSEIEKIADRVVSLRDGRNAGELDHAGIRHDAMVRMMVGRDLGEIYGSREVPAGPVRLEIRNIRTQRYPDHAVSLSVRRGEILGVAGLVGSGRTDLARVVFGIDRPLSGTLLVDGETLKLRSARDAIDAGIVLAPEDRRTAGLIVPMSIRQNVTLPRLDRFAPSGILRRDLERAAAQKARDELAIKAPSVETPVSDLSGGNQQKVVLAKWLSLNPRVILFDEPTRGIDVGARAELYGLMGRLTRQGAALVMISSDMEEILGNSDRVAVMHSGRVTGILERNECTEEAVMRLAVA